MLSVGGSIRSTKAQISVLFYFWYNNSMNDDIKIDRLISEATDCLVNDTPDKAAEMLQELAFMCSKGGKEGQQMFHHLRKLAIEGAKARSNGILIEEKILVAERKLQEKRNGPRIIIN